jgi:hypothetical protein
MAQPGACGVRPPPASSPSVIANATARSRCTAFLGVCLGTVACAQVLYDGALGTLPGAQEWGYAAVPAQLVEASQTGSATRLVTTAANLANAGYAREAPVPLVRDRGFNLVLRIRLNAETHARPDRAGFSVIVLASDQRGIELGFWTNLVFAQADDPLFVHAEEAAFDFQSGWSDLVLSLRGTNYALFAAGAPLLTGRIRDYTPFTGFPDVYETPDFIFLGDDTTSAGADVEIASVALVTSPTLQPRGPDAIEWTGVPGQTYTVEGSADLETWNVLERVTSPTASFSFTHTRDAATPFLRVAHP